MVPLKETKMSKTITREQWLSIALHKHVAPLLAHHGATVPADALVSVGWPGGGSARKRIGECWSRAMSSKGVNEIFISPKISDQPSQMIEILIHEAIHAADDCASGHKGFFSRTAKAVGLEGKMTATVAGTELNAWINATVAKLPKIEHSRLDISGRKKQTTRMLKLSCDECDAVWRMSAQWASEVKCCPCCGGTSVTEG
jgi:hypothetical protein